MKISSVGGRIQTNMGAVSIEPPDSTRTVSIPLTKKREIIGPSGTVKILTYENVNKVPTQASQDSSKISYFIDINGKLQRVGYRDANLLEYLDGFKLNTLITTKGIIAQSEANGGKAFTKDIVPNSISHVRSWLKKCGLKIIKEEEGYKIQEIGGAKRAIEKRNEPPAKRPCVDTSNDSVQQDRNQKQSGTSGLHIATNLDNQLVFQMQHGSVGQLPEAPQQVVYVLPDDIGNNQFVSQLGDQPQQLQNQWSNSMQNADMPVGNLGNAQFVPQRQQQGMALENLGNAQPVPQMQQWNQAQATFQQGPMMPQPYDQPQQQYQNLVQNNVQIMYGQQNFVNNPFMPQGQPIGGAQYVNQGAIGVGNFF